MGNRGVLHNSQGELTGRRWTHKAWIICALEFKGNKRDLMQPGCYTELFFLDEATALSAGQRPCALCRPKDFKKFKSAWLVGNAHLGLGDNPVIGKIDGILHEERVGSHLGRVTFEASAKDLPNGVFVMLPGAPEIYYLLWNGALLPWSPQGYGGQQMLKPVDHLKVLTPRSIVNAIRSGYAPQVGFADIR